MFTLPVKAPLLIFSKLLSALLWTAATGLAAAAACLILTLGQGGFSWISSMFSGLPAATGWLYTLENLLLLLIIVAAQYLMCYACIAVGQLSRHKLLCAVAVYLGASFVSQMVFFIAAVVFASLPTLNWLLNSALNTAWPGAGHVLVGCFAVFHLVFGAIYYFITHLLLTRHLNLE